MPLLAKDNFFGYNQKSSKSQKYTVLLHEEAHHQDVYWYSGTIRCCDAAVLSNVTCSFVMKHENIINQCFVLDHHNGPFANCIRLAKPYSASPLAPQDVFSSILLSLKWSVFT
mmetsp:Transcript_5656/g.8907  ORF Transcript_5656/g.8907 Transcript_5656/m.8907 type:complete len:113 (-) Transcript_5656:104-442(-)